MEGCFNFRATRDCSGEDEFTVACFVDSGSTRSKEGPREAISEKSFND